MVAGSTILAGAALLTLGPMTAGGTAHTAAAVTQEQKLAQCHRMSLEKEPFLEIITRKLNERSYTHWPVY